MSHTLDLCIRASLMCIPNRGCTFLDVYTLYPAVSPTLAGRLGGWKWRKCPEHGPKAFPNCCMGSLPSFGYLKEAWVVPPCPSAPGKRMVAL